MLYEWRTYSFAPGAALRYLEAFRSDGLPLVTRHLPLLGYWLTECGRLNVLHHLWVYADFADRAACRAALAADVEWTQGFGPRAFPMIAAQETAILGLAATSPLLEAAVAGARTVRFDRPGAVLAPGWSLLEIAERPRDDVAPVAAWQVIAGVRPGGFFSLLRTDGAPEALLGNNPAARRELMRPCAFSPLN